MTQYHVHYKRPGEPAYVLERSVEAPSAAPFAAQLLDEEELVQQDGTLIILVEVDSDDGAVWVFRAGTTQPKFEIQLEREF